MVDFIKVGARLRAAKERVARGEYEVIIAGSRGLRGLGDDELVELAVSRSGFKIVKVISGTAQGVDQAGEKWAKGKEIPVDRYPADWNSEGKSAGYNRNLRMAWNADALIAIWDGESRGTKHMIEAMRDREKPVYVLEVIRYWIIGTIPPRKSSFTCLVATDINDVILYVCSDLKEFIGQDISELIEWGDCSLERIKGK